MPNSDFRIRIIMADDHKMIREALTQTLEATGRFEIVAQVGGSYELSRCLESAVADVILMDYSMPGFDPLAATEQITGRPHPPKVLFFSLHENPVYAVKALRAGAGGYVIKSDDIGELASAIEKVYAGEIFLSRAIQSEVLRSLTQPKPRRKGLDLLSAREFEFLRVYAQGGSLKGSANTLGISLSTASTYRSRVMQKLGVSNNADLVRYAIHQDI